MLYAQVNTKQLARALRWIPRELKTELGDSFDYIGRKFLKTFRQERLQGYPGVKARSRGLFTYFRRVSLIPQTGIHDMGIEIFTDSEIAKMHEEGAVLSNPSGGKLAIPLSARTEMFTASGRVKKRYKNPSNLKRVFPLTLRNESYLVQRDRRGSTITPLYALKSKVRIKPRLGFMTTWTGMDNIRIQRINRAVEKALNKV